jgi:ABC-type oligopeptide transport system substrate-binding subunit
MPAIVLRLALLAALVAGVVLFHRKSQEREPRIVAAARDKILLIGNGTEVETLDPDLATGMPEHKVISALFEGLIAPGTDDPDEDAPGAAASWTHEAFTRWTFKLRPNVKVVFVSGYAEDALKRSMEGIGACHFLPKPFSLNELTAKVKECVST